MGSAIVSEQKNKPVFDEQTLAKLLEAAYVLQEHSHELHELEAELGLIREHEAPNGKPQAPERKPAEPILDEGRQPETSAAHDVPRTKQNFDSTASVAQVEESEFPLDMSALLAQLSNDADKWRASTVSVPCHKCGHVLVGEEQFCGQCGAARSTAPLKDGEPVSMQSKLRSPWHMTQLPPDSVAQEVTQEDDKEDPWDEAASRLAPAALNGTRESSTVPGDVPIHAGALQPPIANASDATHQTARGIELTGEIEAKQATAEVRLRPDPAPAADWSSALSAREFLEQISENRQGFLLKFWNEHRGDIYLGIAIVLVLCVLRWGLWINRPVSATNTPPAGSTAVHKVAPQELPLFDRMLIHLGLADPPPSPEDRGNPATAVWVDLQTGLYYCPGADLYGKTPKGKFTSQRDAQLDQFEAAYRKVCD